MLDRGEINTPIVTPCEHLVEIRRECERCKTKNGRLFFLGIEPFTKVNFLLSVEPGAEQGVHGVGALGVPFGESQEPAIEDHLLERRPRIQGGLFNTSVQHGVSLSASAKTKRRAMDQQRHSI